MRYILFLVLILFIFGCTPLGVRPSGVERSGVQRLNLRDPRLPVEAKRWLADAEDEVAIARARVDDAETELTRMKAYRISVIERLEDTWPVAKGAATAAGESASWAFVRCSEQKVELAELELALSKKALDLAISRLTQARAETAIRYDLAIYKIETIVAEVEQQRQEVASIQAKVEEQKISVEKATDEVWKAYLKYVSKGGITNALWGIP